MCEDGLSLGLCAAETPERPRHMTLGSGTPAAGRTRSRSDACVQSHRLLLTQIMDNRGYECMVCI